jgi:hypothetical protein
MYEEMVQKPDVYGAFLGRIVDVKSVLLGSVTPRCICEASG